MTIVLFAIVLSLMVLFFVTKSKNWRHYLIVGIAALSISGTGVALLMLGHYSDVEIWML